MTHFKLLIPLLILILSCNNNKPRSNSSQADRLNLDESKTVPDVVLQNKIDSSYIEKLKFIAENPYSNSYDTLIRGGYSISFYYDKEDQYLIYKKGSTIIDTIGGCSLGLPYKNLGYIGADFDKTFVFVNSFGSGNPHYIRLYDKETAKNLIPEGSAWIDVDTTKQILLYSKSDVPEEEDGDSMTLFDTKTMTQKDYPFPKEIFDEAEKLNRIHLINVTNNTFAIEYEFDDWKKKRRKQYNR
jgi:hypothetical protein